MLRALLLALLCGASCLAQAPTVVINEFRYDDSGTDDREFVELFNASGQPVDLGGWVLDASDGQQPADNLDFTIPPGTILPPGGFWVMGAATVPNVDQALTDPLTGLGIDLFEDDTEALTLRDANSQIVDTVVYEGHRGVWDHQLVEGEPIAGEFESNDLNGTSWARLRDGWDTDDNGRDFVLRPSTPGLSNDLPNGATWVETFDLLAAGTALPGWSDSYRPARVFDPTVVGPDNPSPIPPSPQGGLAAALSVGPGNGARGFTVTRLGAASRDVGVEALVYLDATPVPQGAARSWSIGLRGTSDPFATAPTPGAGAAVPRRSGNTGVAWVFTCDWRGSNLLLVDHGSGGARSERVLGLIRIVPGQNDGWRRLRLLSSGERIHATFGGNGPNDGEQFTGWTADAPGDVYLGYRQTGLAAASALRFDDIRLVPGTGNRSSSGGSGCTGNCPIGNPKPKQVDTKTGASMATGQYAMRVPFDPSAPYTVLRLCLWTSKSNLGATGIPTVAIHAVDFTGLAPVTTPLVTFPLLPPAGGSGDLEGWWATPEFGPIVPTDDFYVVFDYDPANDGVNLPIGVEGSPLPCHYRPGSVGPFSLLATDRAWAWAVVCPTDTAEPVPVDLAAPLLGTDYHLQVQGARPQAAAFLTLGIFDTFWNGLPLPFDLGTVGAPTCSIYTSVEDAIGAITDRAGATSLRLPIPNDPNLAGRTLYEQWLVLDPRANQLGLVTSEKVTTRIGVFY